MVFHYPLGVGQGLECVCSDWIRFSNSSPVSFPVAPRLVTEHFQIFCFRIVTGLTLRHDDEKTCRILSCWFLTSYPTQFFNMIWLAVDRDRLRRSSSAHSRYCRALPTLMLCQQEYSVGYKVTLPRAGTTSINVRSLTFS